MVYHIQLQLTLTHSQWCVDPSQYWMLSEERAAALGLSSQIEVHYSR